MSADDDVIIAEWIHPVEWGKVREFARAVRDPRFGCEPPQPPLTFPVVLSAEFIERFVSELLPLDRQRTVHGEQEYEYLKPLRLVTLEVKLADARSGETVGFERMTAIEQEARGP